jgi:hypothetical protein
VADRPDGVEMGTNSVPNLMLDADFFFVNGEWWKIKDGPVVIWMDAKTREKHVWVPFGSQAYRVSDQPWYWRLKDRGQPVKYLRDLGYDYPSCKRNGQ